MLDLKPSVFNYSDPQSFLRDSLQAKQRMNPLFSVRAWSRQMGFKSHTALVFLLSGKRSIRPSHIPALLKGLKLNENEEKFWKALVHFHSAESEEEKDFHFNQLKILHPGKDFSILEIEKFRLVSDWLHMAILEMTRLADFQSDPQWIQERLFFPVDLRQVNEALNRLINLQLLKRVDGRYVKTNERLTTPKDRPSESIREHHKQVLQNAFEAIDQQTVSERVFNSCTMTIDASKLAQAQELILKFRDDMTKLMEKNPGDETYQLSVQFFKLTTQEKPKCSQTH